MLRRYTIDQVVQKLAVDEAELRFLIHHFREFLSIGSPDGQPLKSLTDQDISILNRANALLRHEGHDPSAIRSLLREELTGKMSGDRQLDILAFSSGRPGTGKTTILWNLATMLTGKGYRCTIFDGSVDGGGISELISQHWDDAQWNQTLQSGVRIISGEKYLNRMMDDSTTSGMSGELLDIEEASDYILVDTGHGHSRNALRYAMVVDETIDVTTPDVGANADCFSVVRMLKDVDPDLRISILVNRAVNLGEARDAFARINGAAGKIGLAELPGFGWVAEDEALRRCMHNGETIIETLPTSISAKCISRLADHLANRLIPIEHQGDGLVALIQALQNAVVRRAVT